MALPSDRLQLLFERHLELLVKFRTQLLNHSCFGDATEVDGLISELHIELGNETVVIHDVPSGSVLSIPEACPVMDSNSIIPEKACTDSNVSSSRKDPLVLPENVSHASSNNQEPGTVLLDADYHSDPLSTSDVPHKFGHNISEEPNFDLLISIIVQPHHPVSFSRFSVQYDKNILNTVKLIANWVCEDPTLFRGGGWARKNVKSGYQLRIFEKREVLGYSEKYPKNYSVKPNAILGLEMVLFSYWSIFTSRVVFLLVSIVQCYFLFYGTMWSA
ncbi:unnamed protein product [Schistosoma margrebowiei]|uniref:Uncharacterized protein n=1 Tax=Schistosoma margrebowiei TaxID=48269 RepID=A0A183LJT5_9TREM|nr:unnamed protein product [Schistosoma margrebowiei]